MILKHKIMYNAIINAVQSQFYVSKPTTIATIQEIIRKMPASRFFTISIFAILPYRA